MSNFLAKFLGRKNDNQKEDKPVAMTLAPMGIDPLSIKLEDDMSDVSDIDASQEATDMLEKKLVWKAICYSYHTHKRRGDVAEAKKMEDLMIKYFSDYKDVDEKFYGMIRPKDI